METEDHPTFFNFRNVLILLGIVMTTIGLVYFANEFSDVISQWGRVLDFALLTVTYVALGMHFSTSETDTQLSRAKGWRWLRTTTAFYILGLVAGASTAIAFLSVDTIDRAIRLLLIVGVGIALIIVAAWRFGGLNKSRKL